MIYLDNAATTAVLPEVVEAMTENLTTVFGNPSSIHGVGRKASQVVRESRKTIARVLDVPERNVIFTSGASEANNQALIGFALSHRAQGNHLLTTAIEHPSVLNTMKYLQKRYGFEVTFVKPAADGSFSAELIAQNLRSNTILVSMMWSNNETGQLLPAAEVGKLYLATKQLFMLMPHKSWEKSPFIHVTWVLIFFPLLLTSFMVPKVLVFYIIVIYSLMHLSTAVNKKIKDEQVQKIWLRLLVWQKHWKSRYRRWTKIFNT